MQNTTDTVKTSYLHDKVGALMTNVNFFSTLFGIFSNLLCICVFSQKQLLNKRINWYLLILALTDFLFCLILFAHYFEIKYHRSTLYDLSQITCYTMDYMVGMINTYSVYLMLVLSVDRLYAIMRPIESKQSFTNRFCKRIALVGLFAIMVIKSPDLILNQRGYSDMPKKSGASVVSGNYANDVVSSSLGDEFALLDTLNLNNTLDDNLKMNLNQIGIDSIYELVIDRGVSNEGKSDYFMQWLSLDMEGPNNAEDGSPIKNPCVNKIFTEEYNSKNFKKLITYIILSNIAMPTLINILPALAILSINLMLWVSIRRYSRNSGLTKSNAITNARNMTKMQKSYYLMIIALSYWLLATSIPYHLLMAYRWAAICNLIHSDKSFVVVQIFSTVFFNSNHFINIIIYLIFHRDFCNQLLWWLIWLFNLNSVVKMNPLYFNLKQNERNLVRVNSQSISKLQTSIKLKSTSFISHSEMRNNSSEPETTSVLRQQNLNARQSKRKIPEPVNIEPSCNSLLKTQSLKTSRTMCSREKQSLILSKQLSEEIELRTPQVKQKLFVKKNRQQT